VLDGALVLDWAKPLAVDTKVKSHVLADFIKLVLRVDRCLKRAVTLKGLTASAGAKAAIEAAGGKVLEHV